MALTALITGATESGFQQAAAMEDSALFNARKLPTAMQAAQYGMDALMRGKVVAVHGFLNKLMAGSVGFAPLSLAGRLVGRLQAKK